MGDFTKVAQRSSKPRAPLITYQELRNVLEKNIHCTTTIAPIAGHILEEVNNVSLPQYYHFDSIDFNVNQNDINKVRTWTDLILYVTNGEYGVAQDSMKDRLFQAACLQMQQRIDSELKGTPYVRQRKRLLEAYGSDGGGGAFAAIKKDPLLADVLCYLNNIQTIILQHNEGVTNVSFAPADPRNWSHNKKIYVIDFDEVAASLIMQDIPYDKMYEYIHSMEVVDPVCIIQWPSATGTKEDFLERLGSDSKKDKKEVLAARIGKLDTMKMFYNWKGMEPDV
jgi:hypothetical protein